MRWGGHLSVSESTPFSLSQVSHGECASSGSTQAGQMGQIAEAGDRERDSSRSLLVFDSGRQHSDSTV